MLCEYSKLTQLFEIFEYLFNCARAIDTWFVCTLPATSHCTYLLLNPVLRLFLPLPLTWPRTGAAACRSRACVLPAPVLTVTFDHVITAGGKHCAGSVERWTFYQYCYGFNFITETCCIWSTWWYWCCQTVALACTCCTLSRQHRAHQKNHLSSATATHSR